MLAREQLDTVKEARTLIERWCMHNTHRIRWAMADAYADAPKLNSVVEADEAYVGGKPRRRNLQQGPIQGVKSGRGTSRTPVVGVVERGGSLRMRVVPNVTGENLSSVLLDNVDTDAILMTNTW